MSFCEEEITWTELIDTFQGIYNKSSSMSEVSILQGFALARELKSDVEEFLDKLAQISLKALICAILENYDIDGKITEATEEIEKLFEEFGKLDDQIATITKGGFQSLDEIENAVSPIFEAFITSKEDIEKLMDEKLKVLFEPLKELGATDEQIETALNEIEFEDNPATYILDVFTRIADSTIENLE